MNNFVFSWFRNLTALENTPVSQEFSIIDPTSADSKSLNTVTLSVAPSDGQSPTMVSLYFQASGVKLFEKKYQDDHDAQVELSAMAKDLAEAASLSKEGKVDEAKNLVSSLISKYNKSSDTLVQPQPTVTMTQASQEGPTVYKGFRITRLEDGRWQAAQDELAFSGDSIDVVKTKVDNMLRKAYGKKLAKRAGITMQNLFFDTVDEAMDYQEKMKTLQGPESGTPGAEGAGQPLWDQMQEQNGTPEMPEGEGPEELAPSNIAPDFKQIEKDKAKQDKDIGKRIKEQVKTEVESALEQKSASVFGPEQEELVDALRNNGRNWDEIKKIFVKELSYNEDDTSVWLDSIRVKEEGGAPEGLPLPPKPPEDLVSPETHDKLVKEIEDKKEPKLEPELKPEHKPLPLEDEIARADNTDIRKVAKITRCKECGAYINTAYGATSPATHADHAGTMEDPKAPGDWDDICDSCGYGKLASLKKKALNPLQEPPAIGQAPDMPLSSPVEENPTFDAPPSPETDVEPELLEAPQQGDRVYVMGDYELGAHGFEGTMVSTYTSKGDEYAVIAKDDGESKEVALHRVVKASQKKVAQVYYEKVAGPIYCKNPDCKRKATVRRPDGNWCEKHAPAYDKKAHEFYPEDPAWGADHPVAPWKCSCGETLTTKNQGLAHFRRHHGKDSDIEAKHEHVFEKKPSGIEVCPCGRFRFPEEYLKTHPPIVEQREEKEADLEVESKSNEDMIRMFVNDAFPKDKMPAWGTANLKITKYPNGWALVNYATPILYRPDNSDIIYFNTDKYSVTTSKIQKQMCGTFAGQNVKETDEAGIQAAIAEPVYAQPELPELKSLHESALKLQAELEHAGQIAIYFTNKKGLDKQASGDSAFESNGWCRVWVDDLEIQVNAKYPEVLKLPDENARIAALKELARDIAHEQLMDAERASNKFGVQSWYEGLTPSRHDRIDWVALASPEPENLESSQDSKLEKKADDTEVDLIMQYEAGDFNTRPDKILELFSLLIKNGHAWSLQGHYGRFAKSLIDGGYLDQQGNILRDAHSSKDDLLKKKANESDICSKCGKEVGLIEMSKWIGDGLCSGCRGTEKQAADPVPPAEGPKEVPTTYKDLKIAPKNTDREKAIPADEQQAAAAQRLESSLISIEALKNMVDQVKTELNKRIKAIQDAGGLAKLEEEKKKGVEQLAALVKATENKLISYGNSLYSYTETTEKVGPKLTDSWRVEKLLKKFEGAEEYLKQAEAGAQSMAEEVTTKTLTKFPKLSRLDKSAGFLDSLTEVYNNVLEALKTLVGEEQKEETLAV